VSRWGELIPHNDEQCGEYHCNCPCGDCGECNDEPDDEDQVQCWHIEPDTSCDWNVCRQPERLARGDYGTDPARGGFSTPRLDALR
jgi:hypothetical protein